MSKLHQSHGRADADTKKGELRKPDDYSNQPGQGGAYQGDGGIDDDADRSASAATPPEVGKSSREYGHSSADRNTMKRTDDFHGFKGGIQRDATPRGPEGAQAHRGTRPDTADHADDDS